jgi:hypothetical protein
LIVKQRDSHGTVGELEALKSAHPREASRIDGEIRKVRAGEKGEQDAAYFLDFMFGTSKNHAVIHDLRIEHGPRVAQIDHLVVNRTLQVFVLETKSFKHGVKITDEGEFLRWDGYNRTYQPIESPIAQCDRHILALSKMVKDEGLTPKRLGITLWPSYHGYVLIPPAAKLYRPEKFDTSRVVKFDTFHEKLNKDFDERGIGAFLANVVSSATMEAFAASLVERHAPIKMDHAARLGLSALRADVDAREAAAESLSASEPQAETRSLIVTVSGLRNPSRKVAAPRLVDPSPAVVEAPAPVISLVGPAAAPAAPKCKACGGMDLSIYSGKFGYHWKCGCGGNTKIELPGKGRLRKQGATFHFAPESGEETVFHVNAAKAPAAAIATEEVPYG